MEQDKQNLLEMIDRPAFIVHDGIITDCNQMAKNRLIPIGKPIAEFMPEECNAYQTYQGGVLYLTLQIGYIHCGATVTRQQDYDVFLMDRDADLTQLQALALAAQQLRVPLSNVMTVADSLLPQLETEPQIEKAAQMRKALFQLMRLISNMADADRYVCLESPKFENTELRNFFRDIVEKANTTLQDSQIAIQYNGSANRIFAAIDRERIERAVYNLLSNAVKFSEKGSCVQVSLGRSERMAYLTVENKGDGIASHVQGSLFHRYMREPAIEDSRFGLGLGMTLVRSVASAHGGTVLLEQGDCTRVTMSLALKKNIGGFVRSPLIHIGDYAGGRDLGLLEFSDSLPISAYEED